MDNKTSNPLEIALLTYGSRGDVEPFLALADGLTAAGHRVRLAAPERYKTLLENDYVQYQGLPGDPSSLADDLRERAGKNPFKLVRAMTRHVKSIAADVFKEIQTTCRGADVILHSFLMTDGGHTLACQERVLDISVQFFPVFQPTSQFPSIVFPDLPLGDTYRRLTHHLTTFVFRWGGRWMYRQLRRDHPNLPQLAEWPFGKDVPGTVPLFFAFSEKVIPKPPDWPDHTLVTGYWHRKRAKSWTPPTSLVAYLAKYERPVFIGLGSMVPQPEKELIELFIHALREINCPGIISVNAPHKYSPWEREDMLITGPMPHDWILPKTRAVVHHGGAGTTGSVIRAGVPSIVIPVSADQFFWGRRMKALKLSPAPIPYKKLTMETLSEALHQVSTDRTIIDQARRTGELVRKEDGVQRTVVEIERLYRKRRKEK